MTTVHSHSMRGNQRRRLDVAGLMLLAISLACGALAYWLIAERDVNALVLVPSVVAATIGAMSLTKLEAGRERRSGSRRR